MRKITLLDKLLLALGFLIVAGIFTLAIILNSQGAQCAMDPVQYMIDKNMTIPIELYKP